MIKRLLTLILLALSATVFAQNYNPQLIDDMLDENRSANAAIHYLDGDLLYVSGLNNSNAYELQVINLKDSSIATTGINSSDHNFAQTRVHFFKFKGKTHFASNKSGASTVWSTDGTVKNTTELFSAVFSYSQIMATSDYLIMSIRNDSLGYELHMTDGTQQGITLLKDIYPGAKNSNIQYLTLHNNMVYFSADNDTSGAELWKTDGTVAGTKMVKDFNAGRTGTILRDMYSFKSELYFLGRSPYDNKMTVFRTDKSDTTIIPLLDKDSVTIHSFSNVSICDSVLYFGGNQTGKGIELCRTNGTQAGTYMVQDLDKGTYSSNPEQITCINGRIYFVADYDKGKELYYTDGSPNGMRLTQDLYPIQTDAFINHLTALDSVLLFSAHSSNNYYDFELYAHTPGSFTRKVKDIYPGSTASRPNHFFTYNNKLYFTAENNTSGREIWVSDGSAGGTKMYWDLMQNTPDNVTVSIAESPNGVLFNASTTDTLDELWMFDVQSNTVSNVIDYNGSTKGSPRELMSTPNGIYYSILPGSFDMEINYYDFKTKEIIEILDNGKKNYVGSFRRTNGKFFYTLKQTLLPNIWVYDEATKKTRVVTSSIQPNGFGADAANLTVVGDRVYFTADNYTEGIELYYTDGVSSKLVKDIYDDYYDSRPSSLCSFKDSFLVFSATTPKNGRELYFTDGTSNGTVILKDIINGSGSSSPSFMVEGNGVVYFAATDNTNGRELWVTDGTEAGTKLVKDLARGTASSNPSDLVYHKDLAQLFFITTDSNNIKTLWATDGTDKGTKAIQTYVDTTFNGSYAIEFAQSSDKLFFTARTDAHGIELWSANKDSAAIVSDIRPGSTGSHPQTLTMANGYLFFTADDEVHGRELWYMNASCLKANMAVIDNVCLGDTVKPSVSINSLFDTKSVTYDWKLDDSTMSSATVYTPVIDSAGTYTLSLQVENKEGCKSKVERQITAHAYPTASFTINQDTQCLRTNNVVLTNTSSGDNNAYAWNFGDNTTSTTTNPTKKYNSAITFTINLIATVADACADTATDQVVISSAPTTSSIFGPNTSDNDQEDFSANTSSSNKNIFEWSVTNGTIVSGQGTKKITVKWNKRPTTGIIKLTETSPEGCVGNQVSKTCKVSRNASITDVDNDQIVLWPNPSTGILHIKLYNPLDYTSLEVKDYLGKTVYRSNAIASTTTLDLNLTTGVYFVTLSGPQNTVNKKVIVQR